MMGEHYPLFYTFHFYFFGVVSIFSAIAFVTRKSPVTAALWLVNTMFSLSALYILLDAQFIGAMQVLVYAGAIMVVFLFVVMLLNLPTETPPEARSRLLGGAGPRHFGAVLSVALVVELAWAVRHVQTSPMPSGEWETSVNRIGLVLFRDYAFAFEATSVLILVAMVGAIVLARRESK